VNKLLYIVFSLIIVISVLISTILLVIFTGNILPEYSLDQLTATSSTGKAILINLLLLALFGIQHSVMARKGVKINLRKWVPAGLERMVYVLLTSIILAIIVFYWQPIPIIIWNSQGEWLNTLIYTVFFLGWFLVFSAPALQSGPDFLGIRQLGTYFLDKKYPVVPFATPIIYKLVRHPMYLGFLIAFYCSPIMTVSHLMFAAGMTVYILIAVRYEERDLAEKFGAVYEKYQESTPMLLPGKLF